METRSVSEWVYVLPHLRFALPNQQPPSPNGRLESKGCEQGNWHEFRYVRL